MQFNNLEREYLHFKAEIDEVTQKTMASGRYLFGENVSQLEENFKQLTGKKYAIACKNATDAITVTCNSLESDNIHKIYVPDFGAYPTALAVNNAQFQIGFLPVDNSLTINPQSFNDTYPECPIIIAVDLFGNECKLKEIRKCFHEAILIQDCAQSTDTKRDYSIADINIFSFYPTKPLAAMGDGGMICINDEDLAEQIRKHCFYGLEKEGNIINPGLNSRMDEIQAGIVNVKFPHLDWMNQKRVAIAKRYLEVLPEFMKPMQASENCIFHQFPVLVENRKELIHKMNMADIPFMIHYPKHISDMKCFKYYYNHKIINPIADKIISIPCNTWMLEEEIEQVEQFLHSLK